MSDPSTTENLSDSDTGSDSDNEAWVTPYDSEFDMTLSDIDEDLLEAMQNFNVDGAPDSPRIHHAPGLSTADETQYNVAGGTTSNWSEAAQAQRGGAHVHATVKRKKVKFSKPWIVVIVGRPPGVYAAREASVHVEGVSNAIYQGFTTRETAESAWAVAQEAGLVGSNDGLMPLNINLEPLPLASDRIPPPSPLSTPGTGRRFYAVYRGRVTGIFNSSLESGLSVVGVAGNAHESCESYNVALTKYRRAINRGEVKTLRG